MIDEKKITYNTYMSYRNIIINYFLKVWEDKLITSLQRVDLIAALDAIPNKVSVTIHPILQIQPM